MKKFLVFLSFSLLFAACSSDDDNGGTPPPPQDPAASIIYVANEGGFGQGTASLTTYNVTEGVVFQNVYELVNGEPLGDILQSIYLYNDELYLVVNNSEKIEVCNASSFQRKRSITGLDSPRHMLFLSDEKAYVSDLFAGGIHVVNPTLATYTSFITTGTWLENMILHNGEVWATNAGGDGLVLINPESDALGTPVTLSAGANSLAVDGNGDVWVLCQGDFAATFPSLFRVNGSSKAVDATWSFMESMGYGGTLRMAPDGEHVYFLLAGNVYKMGISATELPSEPFISGGDRNFYGFHINPSSGEIALTDAGDFQGAGQVYLYDVDGNETFNFTAGIIPGYVTWSE
jgi:hypothetical protein